MKYEITDTEAYRVYDSLMGFYNSFDSIEEYSLLKKKEHNVKFGSSLNINNEPLYSERLFNDYTISPNDMNFELKFVDSKKDNDMFDVLLNLISSHSNVAVPGKNLKVIVYETTANKIVGFIRLSSPTLNMKPRSEVFKCNVANQYDLINNNMIVGTIIVPTQPFGYNCLGGKLLALIASSNEIRNEFNRRYRVVEDDRPSLIPVKKKENTKPAVDIRYFETTSLYGSIKGVSQYDGLKPYMRNGGFTESAIVPMPTNEIVYGIYDMFKRFKDPDGFLGVANGASSKKLKVMTKVYSLILNKLKEIDMEKHDTLKSMMKHKQENITTRKLYYYSTYGVGNIKEHLIDGEDAKFNIPASRFDMSSMIDWWKKKSQKRYDKLKQNNDLRQEIELWTDENIECVKHKIIR